jgi:hypothetical protein
MRLAGVHRSAVENNIGIGCGAKVLQVAQHQSRLES